MNNRIGTTAIALMSVAAIVVSPITGAASVKQTPDDQQEITLNIDDKAWVNAATGRATVTGNVSCTHPAEIDIYVSLVQRKKGKDKKKTGSDYAYVSCDGVEKISLLVGGDFTDGKVGIDGEAHDWVLDAQATTSLIAMMRECTFIGSLDDDYIRGTGKDDKICGLAGDDVLIGRGGDDELRGHDGDDRIEGGRGEDLLTGGLGADTLNGQAGDDKLYGDQGPDDLDGGSGKDGCRGEEGHNRYKSCEKKI